MNPARRQRYVRSRRDYPGMARTIALPASAHAFRLPGSTGEPYWPGDDMGGVVDPNSPNPSRREFLIRAAVAVGVLTAGGAINVLTMSLARRSEVARATAAPGDERR